MNKVTPQKKDVQQYFESFSVDIEPDTTSENGENAQNCPEAVHFMSESTTISDLLYQNQSVEPDSTSEDKVDQPKKKKIKPMSGIDSEAMSSGSMFEPSSNDQYLQYLVDSESQQETSTVQSTSKLEKIFEKPFQCPYPGCSHRVTHKKNLFRHKRQKHGAATANGARVVRRHICKICGKKNLNYSNFKRHHSGKHAGMPENYEEKSLELIDTANEE